MPHTRDAILTASDPISPISIPPSQTAILLLDYHTFLFSRVPASSGPTVISATKTLRTWATSNNALIIHGLIDALGPVLPSFKGLSRVSGMQEMLKSQPDPSAMISEHPEIAAPGSDTAKPGKEILHVSKNEVVVKRTMGCISALKSEGLMELLKERGIKSLVIGGLSTSGCVAATARPAADEGFVVTVIEDACADPKEAVHDMVLEDIVSSQAHVCTSKEFVDAWGKAGEK